MTEATIISVLGSEVKHDKLGLWGAQGLMQPDMIGNHLRWWYEAIWYGPHKCSNHSCCWCCCPWLYNIIEQRSSIQAMFSPGDQCLGILRLILNLEVIVQNHRAPIVLPCFAICNGFSLGMDQESSSSCHSFALPKLSMLVIRRSTVNISVKWAGKIWLQLMRLVGPFSRFSAETWACQPVVGFFFL